MKVTLESTTSMAELTINGVRVPARIWQGETASGVPVHAYVTLIVPEIPRDDPRQSEFVRELEEQARPRPAVEAIPLRLIL